MKLTIRFAASGRTLAACAGLWAAAACAAAQPSLGAEPSAGASFQFPAVGSPGTRHALLLAIDGQAFPLRRGLALYLTKPVIRREPVLAPSTSPGAPDNVAAHFDATVLHENGRFRMWYYALHAVPPEGGYYLSPVCYAESDDGVHWSRPNLGQVEWHGSRANNCLAIGDDPAQGSNGAYVIRDDDDPRPERRYKMAFGSQNKKLDTSNVATAVSPDGIHWKKLPGSVTGGAFAEVGSFYKHGGLYIVNAQSHGPGEGDRPQGRTGYAWISPDFDHWLPEPAPSFKVAEPVVGSGGGTHGHSGGLYTQDHIGVGGASFGNVVVGLWGMWRNRVPNWGEGGINCDLGLLVSHDGLRFDEVVKGLPYIRSEESPAQPVPGRNYPTILIQGNGIVDVGEETFIYHGRWLNVPYQQLTGTVTSTGVRFRDVARDYWGGIALARIPRDRWGALALSEKHAEGSVWTLPVTLPADPRLGLNAAGLAGFRVEVADARFQPLPGFGQGTAGGPKEDAFDAEVRWPGRALRELAGRTVRFHLRLARAGAESPRLFALNLTQAP